MVPDKSRRAPLEQKNTKQINLSKFLALNLLNTAQASPGGRERRENEEKPMRALTLIALSLTSFAVMAGTPGGGAVPEPGTIGLLTAAVVAGIAFARGRKK
jgi:hypothetical protein